MTPQRSLSRSWFDSLPLEWRRAAAYRASLEHLGYALESMTLVVVPPGSRPVRGGQQVPAGKRGLCVHLAADGLEFQVLAAIINDLDPDDATLINGALVERWNALTQDERNDVRKTLVDTAAFMRLTFSLVEAGFKPPVLVAKGIGKGIGRP